MTASFSRRALLGLIAVPTSAFAIAVTAAGTSADVAVPDVPVASTTYTVLGSRTPNNVSDPDAVGTELGMKFKSSQAGTVLGVRFYKSADNTGTHTGTLWTTGGTRLATATFANETATGWQTVRFSTPVAIKSNTNYIVSYHTNTGHYSGDNGGFNTPIVSGPLTGLTSYYRYGSSGFPTSSYQAANYYVDALVSVNTTTSSSTSSTSTTSTSTSTTTTTAPSTTTAWPGAANTGVPTGTTLTPRGSFSVTTAGAVLDALDVTGTVYIDAPNVVIKRSRFTGNGSDYGVLVRSGSVQVEDSEFRGNFNGAAIGHDNWKLLRSEITGVPYDATKIGSNVLLQDNWMHDFATATGAHADGGQVQNGISNTVVRHNNIELSSNQNSALFIAPDLGPSSSGPLVIENNRLGGGNYTLFVVDGNNGQYFINNITVRNNHFLRAYKYGPSYVNVPVTASGNVWDDTGAAVSL